MEKVRLGDICVLHYGKSLTANKRINGNVPVYSSAGLIGYHNVPLVNNRGIIIGRKGTVGKVYKTDKPFYCIDTAFYILMAINFSLDFKITSFFNVEKAFEFIKGNVLNYVLLVFYCLLLAMINIVVNAILINGQIFSLFIPFVTFYVYLVYTDLFAQFALNKPEIECHEQKCFI